jgi:hypothetical protein
MANFSRRPKCSRVKAFPPNGAPARQHAVNSACEAHGQTDHPARKRHVVVGLHEQVKMIVLHAEVHDAKPPPRSGGEPPAQGRKHDGRPQTRQMSAPAQRDVYGVPRAMPRTGAMRFAIEGRPDQLLAASRRKGQCELPCCSHWRGVLITYHFDRSIKIANYSNSEVRTAWRRDEPPRGAATSRPAPKPFVIVASITLPPPVARTRLLRTKCFTRERRYRPAPPRALAVRSPRRQMRGELRPHVVRHRARLEHTERHGHDDMADDRADFAAGGAAHVVNEGGARVAEATA